MDKLFFAVFEHLPRQGPGNRACTERAFRLCEELPAAPRILDLGCGAGAQTLDLARLTAGSIVAVDRHAPLIDRLRARVGQEDLLANVEATVADMEDLDLAPASFDLVWSEGALYNLGLERALPMCARFLRPGGYLAFTDAVWLSNEAPPDVRAAFADYPTMGTREDVLSLLARDGWSVVGQFDLPEEAWWDDFYRPMERRIAELRGDYGDDEDAFAALDEIAREPEMRRESGRHYGYAFFVARRPRGDARPRS